jgi:hypothetical protein
MAGGSWRMNLCTRRSGDTLILCGGLRLPANRQIAVSKPAAANEALSAGRKGGHTDRKSISVGPISGILKSKTAKAVLLVA